MKQKTYLNFMFIIFSLGFLSVKLVDISAIVFSLNVMDVNMGWKIVHIFWYTVPPITLCFLLLTWLVQVREGKGFFIVEDEKQQRKLKNLRRIWLIFFPWDFFFENHFYEIICAQSFATRIYELTRSRAYFSCTVMICLTGTLCLTGYETAQKDIRGE